MTTTVSGSSITFNDNTTQNTSAYGGGFAFRNRIINGGMVIDQRNNGASVTPANGGADYIYTLDRWRVFSIANSKFSVQQNAGSVTPPVGFTNYLGITSLAATSVGSTDLYLLSQRIEGFNFADLNWGTVNAATVTLSFQVRSSLTGTFGGALQNSANNRTYPFSYTISSANTWTSISVTIAGDTSGTWIGATNGVGCSIQFGLGVGSTYSGTAGTWSGSALFSATGAVSVVGTNGATFYITGVQLEKGSTATSFDYRPYGTELALCQRYFEKSAEPETAINSANDATFLVTNLYNNIGTGQYYADVIYKVIKRAAPTITLYPYTTPSNTGRWSNDSGTDYGANSATVPNGSKTWGFNVANTSGGTLTVGSQKLIIGSWYASAEL